MPADKLHSHLPTSDSLDETESARDIRERALGDSDQRYKLLFEKNLAAMYLTTLDGRILDVNHSFARLLGYDSPGELCCLTAWDLYPVPGDREGFLAELRSRGSLEARETRMRRRDGSSLWVLEDVRLLADEFICGMMIDITRRKRAEDEANQSREFLRLLIESTDDVVLMQNPDGMYIYANPSSSYGIAPEQVVGKNPYDLFDRQTAERMMTRLQAVIRTRKTMTVEDPVVWRGETLWFHSRLYPVFGDEGAVVAVSTFGRNITDQHSAVEGLRSAEQRLHVEQLRMQIAADLHDDIGSVLSSIAIYATMAKQAIEKGTLQSTELLDKVEQNARTAMHTLDEIVWSVNPESDQLGSIVARLEEYPRELLGLRGIEYHSTVEGAVTDQQLPPEKRRNFYLIFREGLNNVLRHSGASRAELTLRIHAEGIVMELRDNGKGFDTRAETEGNGLRNMRRRAQALGGSLQINSAADRGTMLVLSFPLT